MWARAGATANHRAKQVETPKVVANVLPGTLQLAAQLQNDNHANNWEWTEDDESCHIKKQIQKSNRMPNQAVKQW